MLPQPSPARHQHDGPEPETSHREAAGTNTGGAMLDLTPEWIEECCEVMHDAYEKAAIGEGWKTQIASRKPWADVPEANKATMRAAVEALLQHVLSP